MRRRQWQGMPREEYEGTYGLRHFPLVCVANFTKSGFGKARDAATRRVGAAVNLAGVDGGQELPFSSTVRKCKPSKGPAFSV